MPPSVESETIGDATALAGAIAAGVLSAGEAMEAAIAAASHHTGLGAICRIDEDRGRAAAARLDEERRTEPVRFAARPFAGVPTLAKDLGGPFAGFAVRAGSRMLDGMLDPKPDSDLADRFREAGLALFGLTTSPEFGLSLASEPDSGPLCRNPLDPGRTAGGSSGGAASAVAAGIVAIAHATDAGGSIRVPAACCGLVGLKPTRGAIPGGPHFGNHLGGIVGELAVCRSVRDTRRILEAVHGRARGPFADPAEASVADGGLRIGVLTQTGADFPTEPARSGAVEAAAKTLEARGHRIVALDWPAFAGLVSASSAVFADIVSINLANLVDALSLDLGLAEPLTRAFVERGRRISAGGLWTSLDAAVHVSHNTWALFDSLDCLLMPMLATAPLAVGSFPSDHDDTDLHLRRMTAFAPLAGLANISGFPALTLPYGADGDGLPLPVQLMAPMGGERLLLSLAASLEGEGRWQHRFPIAGLAA